jgi:hypothetical protein
LRVNLLGCQDLAFVQLNNIVVGYLSLFIVDHQCDSRDSVYRKEVLPVVFSFRDLLSCFGQFCFWIVTWIGDFSFKHINSVRIACDNVGSSSGAKYLF